MMYKDFDAWFDEVENFSTRGERFYDEMRYMTTPRAVEWLRAAWECARTESEDEKVRSVR